MKKSWLILIIFFVSFYWSIAATAASDVCLCSDDSSTCLTTFSGYSKELRDDDDRCNEKCQEFNSDSSSEIVSLTEAEAACTAGGSTVSGGITPPSTSSSSGWGYKLVKGLGGAAFIIPQLNVYIPGLIFSPVAQENGVITVNFLGEWVAGIYKYLLGFAAFFAVVMLMIGGVEYIISLDGKNVSKAKTRINKALTGIVLLACVYTMLFLVNPNFVFLKPLNLRFIDPEALVIGYDNTDSEGSVSGTVPLTSAGIICPKNTNTNSLKQIAESFVGHVAYRYGGKGGPPPYNFDTHVDDCGGTPCKSFCPKDNMCFDCSGFANYVRFCAGLQQAGFPTFNANSEKINSCDPSSNSINGVVLKPGDFVGWGRGDNPRETSSAHIMIYIGDGLIADSHGSGRAAGQGVKANYSLSNICHNATIHTYRILRVQ